MGEILFYIIIIAAAILLFGFLRAVSKRIFLISKLTSLKRDADAKIKYRILPFFSLIKLSAKPEITVELGERVYLIRLIGARSGLSRVHFASPEYIVTVKGRLSEGKGKKHVWGTRRGFLTVSPDNYIRKTGKVRILPKLNIPENGAFCEKKLIPVLIFNPSPHEVTYVTKEKNRVVAAFTGDEVYGQLIFTASSFVTYAERSAREEKEAIKSSSYWDEYFS